MKAKKGNSTFADNFKKGFAYKLGIGVAAILIALVAWFFNSQDKSSPSQKKTESANERMNKPISN